MAKRVALVTVVAIVVLDHLAFVGDLFSFQVNIAVALALLVAVLASRAWRALHLVIFALLFATSFYVPLGGLGAGHLLAALALSAAILLPSRTGRDLLRWFRRGHIDKLSALLIALTIVVAAVALVLWAENTSDLGGGLAMARSLRQVPTALVLGVVVPLFALINAFAEEAVYRGVYQEALARVIPFPWLVVPLQAAPFAALHFAAGFPNGVLGYVMVLVWGTMLGYLRWRTRGMLAPWIVHVGADLVIALYLWSRVA
jgi:membrane protease YdiL (CAAX protease family)